MVRYNLNIGGWLVMLLILPVPVARADTIFFTSNNRYERNLELINAGSADDPLVITSTGMEKAIIDAGSGYAIQLKNCNHVIVDNLAFEGDGRLSGNTENGVILDNCSHVNIRDLEISGFQHAGLLVKGASTHVSIEHVHAHDNGFAGIHVIGEWPGKEQCRNIYIGHCKAENNPGDPTILDNHSGNGIIVGSCDSVLIEYCEALENGWDMPREGNGPVGIWAWNADHVTIQHCIAHHNKTAPEAADGGGFDLDGGVTNSVIQYCLSYENEGAGFGLFQYSGASPWQGNTIRYNLSINDGIKNGNTSLMVWNGNSDPGLLTGAYIYNNVFYNDRNQGSATWFISDLYLNFYFMNNIFLTDGSAIRGDYDHAQFKGNVYWNLGNDFRLGGYASFSEWVAASSQEKINGVTVGLNTDPLLAAPGPVTVTDPDSLDMITLSGFLLQAGSPLIDQGLDIRSISPLDPGAWDFFGQPIPGGSGFDPGIHELQNTYLSRSSGQKDGIKILQGSPGSRLLWLEVEPSLVRERIRICFLDLSGRILHSSLLMPGNMVYRLELPSRLPKGNVYLVTASSGNIFIIEKLML